MKRTIFIRTIGIVLIACFLSFLANTAVSDEVLEGKTVNVNIATIEDLAQVPLISPELAEAIVEYREDMGDFQVIEELMQVDGFSRKLLRKIKTFLILEGIGGDECTC